MSGLPVPVILLSPQDWERLRLELENQSARRERAEARRRAFHVKQQTRRRRTR